MLRHASKPLCAAPKNGCCGMLRLHMLGGEEWKETGGAELSGGGGVLDSRGSYRTTTRPPADPTCALTTVDPTRANSPTVSGSASPASPPDRPHVGCLTWPRALPSTEAAATARASGPVLTQRCPRTASGDAWGVPCGAVDKHSAAQRILGTLLGMYWMIISAERSAWVEGGEHGDAWRCTPSLHPCALLAFWRRPPSLRPSPSLSASRPPSLPPQPRG